MSAIDKYNKLPIIKLSDFTNASQYVDTNPIIQKMTISDQIFYFVRSSATSATIVPSEPLKTTRSSQKKYASDTQTNTQTTTQRAKLSRKKCNQFIRQILDWDWEEFDVFASVAFDIYFIQLNEIEWRLSTCSCQFWFKNYYCKHVIGLENITQLFKFDQKAVPLGEKSKKRAQKKVRHALSYD